jgi:hypothetical protein
MHADKMRQRRHKFPVHQTFLNLARARDYGGALISPYCAAKGALQKNRAGSGAILPPPFLQANRTRAASPVAEAGVEFFCFPRPACRGLEPASPSSNGLLGRRRLRRTRPRNSCPPLSGGALR